MSTTHQRDRETARTVAGVRVNPTHWASVSVHAFRTWTGDHSMTTWCRLDVDFEDGARQTTDLISCVQCAEASWQALQQDRPVFILRGAS